MNPFDKPSKKMNSWKKPALTKPPSMIFVPRDLDLSPLGPQINKFPGLTVERFFVKLGDSSCIVFAIIIIIIIIIII